MELCICSSHYKENISWLYNSPVPVFIVSKGEQEVDESKFFKVHSIKNRGSEFGSYLWFIVNYWNELPDKIAFIHGHETSHHQTIPIFDALSRFKDRDFHGLNGPKIVSYHYFLEGFYNPWFPDPLKFWNYLGLNDFVCIPTQLVFQGGTQTIISKELIKFHNLEFYERLLERIMSLPLATSWTVGVFLEIVWHVLFQQSPINFELFYPEMHRYCVNEKQSIIILGPNSVWSSSMKKNSVFFETRIEDQNTWVKACESLLYTYGDKI